MSENLFRLDGKIAVVTGGAGNLGPSWTKALNEFGAKVAIIDLANKKISSYYQADITDLNNLHAVHKKINKDLGLISVIVNNAGIDTPPGSAVSNYQQMWQVN